MVVSLQNGTIALREFVASLYRMLTQEYGDNMQDAAETH